MSNILKKTGEFALFMLPLIALAVAMFVPELALAEGADISEYAPNQQSRQDIAAFAQNWWEVVGIVLLFSCLVVAALASLNILPSNYMAPAIKAAAIILFGQAVLFGLARLSGVGLPGL